MTAIKLEVRDHSGALLDAQTRAYDISWTDELRSPGSGSFRVAVRDLSSTVQIGRRIRILVDGTARAAFVVDSMPVTLVGTGEDADRVVEVSGQGLLAVLDEAIVYPASGTLGTVTTRDRTITGNPGAILKTLVDEAKARGCLSDVTLGFTATAQSPSGSWPTSYSYVVPLGTTLQQVVDELVAAGWCDVWMDPNGTLQARATRGTDKSSSVVLWPGRHISAQAARVDGPLRNTILWAWGEQLGASVDTTKVTAYGRRETFKIVPTGGDTASRDAVITAMRNLASTVADELTGELVDAEGARPYVDFGIGDTIKAPGIDGQQRTVRVLSLTGSLDAAGELRWTPRYGTERDELQARLAKTQGRSNVDRYEPWPTITPSLNIPGITSPLDVAPSRLYYSDDGGANWIAVDTPNFKGRDTSDLDYTSEIQRVAVSPDGVIVIAGAKPVTGPDQLVAYRSIDGGDSWTECTGSIPTQEWNVDAGSDSTSRIRWLDGLDAFVAYGTPTLQVSHDGLAWTASATLAGTTNNYISQPVWDGTHLVYAYGKFSSGQTLTFYTSTDDGATWSSVDPTTGLEVGDEQIVSLAHWKGQFYALIRATSSGAPTRVYRSDDLVTWTQMAFSGSTLGSSTVSSGGRWFLARPSGLIVTDSAPAPLITTGDTWVKGTTGFQLSWATPSSEQYTMVGIDDYTDPIHGNVTTIISAGYGGQRRTVTNYPWKLTDPTDIATGPNGRIWVSAAIRETPFT